MNLSQIQDIQYLFRSIFRDSSRRLIVKYNTDLITADFYKQNEYSDPTLLDVEDENKNIVFRNQFKDLRRDFVRTLSNYQTNQNYLEKNQELVLLRMIELVKSKSYDIQENIIYDVHFLNSDKKYDFYLVSDTDSFEVVSLTD